MFSAQNDDEAQWPYCFTVLYCTIPYNTILYCTVPDIVAVFPGVVTPAQEWGGGESQGPGPAPHQQDLARLRLQRKYSNENISKWSSTNNLWSAICHFLELISSVIWTFLWHQPAVILSLQHTISARAVLSALTGNLMISNLQRDKHARLHIATIPM